MALEVGKREHRVVVQHMGAHVHFIEPLAAGNGQGSNTFFVHDVYRTERPAVVGDGFAMLFGGVAVAFVIGVGFDDGGIG